MSNLNAGHAVSWVDIPNGRNMIEQFGDDDQAASELYQKLVDEGDRSPRKIFTKEQTDQLDKDFRVEWVIDSSDCETPREAAEYALRVMRDPSSIATVFDVYDAYGNMTRVDLDHSEEDEYVEPEEPTKLRDAHDLWIAQFSDDRLTEYKCINCEVGIKTLRPTEGQGQFDSSHSCPDCSYLMFVTVEASGQCTVVDMVKEEFE